MQVFYDNSTFPGHGELMRRHAKTRSFTIVAGALVLVALIISFLALLGGYRDDLVYYVVLATLLVLLLFAVINDVMVLRKEKGIVVVSGQGLQLDDLFIDHEELVSIEDESSERFIEVRYRSGTGRDRGHLLDTEILCDVEAFLDAAREVWPDRLLSQHE